LELLVILLFRLGIALTVKISAFKRRHKRDRISGRPPREVMFPLSLLGSYLFCLGVKKKKTPVDVGTFAALLRTRHESQPPGREVMRVDGKRRWWENRVRQYMAKKQSCAIIRLPLKGHSKTRNS